LPLATRGGESSRFVDTGWGATGSAPWTIPEIRNAKTKHRLDFMQAPRGRFYADARKAPQD
jgi:hypothetical protein